MNLDEYAQLIADSSVYDVAEVTPLEEARNLSARTGNRILMKREDLQSVFSFKLRGAYNKLSSLPAAELEQGVICSSAGNHAQGVALAARQKGIRAVVVMPVTTPSIKIEAVRALDGEVVLHGDAYDDAYAHARELEREQGLTFIHPFDDPLVIAGQGTIGKEILDQVITAPDAVFVPVGGGGLIAGIAASIKHTNPDIRVIGVEPDDSQKPHGFLRRSRLHSRSVRVPKASITRASRAVVPYGSRVRSPCVISKASMPIRLPSEARFARSRTVRTRVCSVSSA